MIYNSNYDLKSIRGEYKPLPESLIALLNKKDCLLDAGCGSCRKALQIAKYVKIVYAMDSSPQILAQAIKNVEGSKISNIKIVHGDNSCMPFNKRFFDSSTAILTTWSAAELHRVLKRGGRLYLEVLSPDDKIDLKREFGKDMFGWRGRLMNQSVEERLFYIKAQLEPFFVIKSIEHLEYEYKLPYKDVVDLLMNTPTIRDFSTERDSKSIERITYNGFVDIHESRYGICCITK